MVKIEYSYLFIQRSKDMEKEMDTKGIIMSVVAVAVAVLVVVTCAIPIFASATETERTFTNEGYYRMSSVEDCTFVWNHTSPLSFIVNGENVTIPQSALNVGYGKSVIITDTKIVRLFDVGEGNYALEIWGNGDPYVLGVNTTDNQDVTVNITTSSITWTESGESPVEYSHDGYAYVISNDGDYVMKKQDSPAYMTSDSVLIGGGISTFKGTTYGVIHIDGNIEDVTITGIPDSTISNISINLDGKVSGYEGLYKFDNITFTTSYDGEDASQTYSYLVVPSEVTVELSIHPSDVIISLLSVVPLLMVLGIVVAAVGMFLRNRAGAR